MTINDDAGRFSRFHGLFTFHLGIAVALAWVSALSASLYAPWVRNIRPLLDPGYSGKVESTGSFLFIFPTVMAAAWLLSVFGRDALRQVQILKSEAIEFGVAGLVSFVLFYVSVDRAVAAFVLAL
ncbi:hypothetical protein [Microvirga antarctica]|uniref:hypothetical protein n=1 Tax=Microvirga antarctica TaxID=2819233 RepID=UPI001B316268|nr:hypothetical protein [Microvirga antarctica]